MPFVKYQIIRVFTLFLFLYSFTAFAQDTIHQDSSSLISLTDTIIIIPDTVIKPDTVIIIGVGDIMLGTSYPSRSYLPPGDNCYPLLEQADSLLKSADITMGNCEGSFLDEGAAHKKCRDPKKCYVFRMPEKYAHCLADAGFDFMSLANNHIRDFGHTGTSKTTNIFDTLGIHYAGLLNKKFDTIVKNNIIYGFCAFSPNNGTCRINDYDGAIKIVQHLDSICDIVIVSFHGGAEGAAHQHITKRTENFYGENRGNVYEFSHKMIDAGADLIFGNGPHVSRAIEIYKDRFIAYSLGNFCTYHRFNVTGPNGLAPLAEIKVSNKGEFISGKIHSFKQEGEGGALYDANQKAFNRIKSLTIADFPELVGKLVFTEDGSFHYIEN